MDGGNVLHWLRPLVQFRLAHLGWLVFVCALGAMWWRPANAGLLSKTDRELDIAILGKGYFQVQSAETGECYYTRNGHFSLNTDGILTVGHPLDGWMLQPPIAIPDDWTGIHITPGGQVIVARGGRSDNCTIGSIELARFRNEEGLDESYSNFFIESKFSGAVQLGAPGVNGFGWLKQHWVENVDQDWLPTRPNIVFVLLFSLAVVGVLEIRRIHRRLDEIVRPAH